MKWKIIKDNPNYSVSDTGLIKRNSTNKQLKPWISSRGYLYVSLSRNGKVKKFSIHRLVAKYFIPNIDNLKCINHKDCNKLNNHSDNLEWCSNFYNTCYKISKQVMNIDTGEKYLSISDAVRATGITHISDVCKGKRPKAGGCRWKFIDNIIPKQNISPLKEGDVPLWQD